MRLQRMYLCLLITLRIVQEDTSRFKLALICGEVSVEFEASRRISRRSRLVVIGFRPVCFFFPYSIDFLDTS